MEIDSRTTTLIIITNIVVGIWATALLSALAKLSWGRIKKLDSQKRKKLINRAEHCLERRDSYRIVIRLIALTNLVIMACCTFLFILQTDQFAQSPVATICVSAIVVAAVFVLASELLGAGWLSSHPWTLLTVSYPVLRLMDLTHPLMKHVVAFEDYLHSRQDNQEDEEVATTEDEIISLVEQDAHETEEKSTLEDSERQMIRGIFDLDDRTVKEIMTPRVDLDALKIDTSLADVKKMIVETGHSRIPVYRERIDDIEGVVYAKDLLNEEKLAGGLEGVIHEAFLVPETKQVSELLEEFKQNEIHIAIILDEYGGTAGVVTIEDIIEEIVGEIRDEYDTNEEETECVRGDDGSVIADARTSISEINELLELSISEEEDFDTIGGYVISEVGRIPRTAEVLQVDDLEVTILEADARKVSKLKLISTVAETVDSSG